MDLSVIIPCYNVEKYIEECFTKIVQKSSYKIEYIFIDDGSTDRTNSILYTLSEKSHNKNIIILKQKNKGMSAARNVGIETASGDNFLFIDSDDFVSENYIDEMLKTHYNNQSDITSSNLIKYPFNVEIKIKDRRLNSKKVVNNWPQVVWGKIFKKDIISTDRFKDGAVFEDTMFTPATYMRATKFSVCRSVTYFYRQSVKKSVMMTKWPEQKYWDLFFELSDKYSNTNASYLIFASYVSLIKNYPKVIETDFNNDRMRSIGKSLKVSTLKTFILFILLKLKMKKMIIFTMKRMGKV